MASDATLLEDIRESMADPQVGVSIRFVRASRLEWSDDFDGFGHHATRLALHDTREDVSWSEKVGDALRFLWSHRQ